MKKTDMTQRELQHSTVVMRFLCYLCRHFANGNLGFNVFQTLEKLTCRLVDGWKQQLIFDLVVGPGLNHPLT